MRYPKRVFSGPVFCLAALLAALPVAAQDAAPQPGAAAAAPAPKLRYSNKWRIEVSEGANNDGVMTFRLTPKDGAPVDIPVALRKGRSENGCAQDVRDTFRKTLDKNTYKIEVDDGEDVLVKKRKGPDFSVELVESTVKGTHVSFERE